MCWLSLSLWVTFHRRRYIFFSLPCAQNNTPTNKMSPEEIIERFKLLGLNEQKAKETLKNGNVTKSLLAALDEVI